MIASLTQENELLREQLRLLKSQRFGRRSEKFDHPTLFDEAETADQTEQPEKTDNSVDVKAHKRRKKGRKPLSDDLPRIDIIHELPESERICSIDGHALEVIGEEVTEQLDYIPAKVQVLRHIQKKYACPHCRKGIHTAKKPPQPIAGSIATASLLAFIVVSKYLDGLPLYRLTRIFDRIGVELSRATMANWMVKMGKLVQPLINLMQDMMLDYDILQMDETTVQVLKEPGRKASSKSYMWVRRGGPPDKKIILFDYDASRGAHVPETLLANYKGFLQTDGYNGYGPVAAAPNIVRVGCMAHARRKFDEALRSAGKKKRKTSLAAEAIQQIGKLYAIEKQLRKEKASPAQRLKVRQEQARPILDSLRVWLDKNRPRVLPSSATGKALNYLHEQWDYLIRYLDDGRLEIDNNAVERAIRPFTIGRKNWLFSNSTGGAKASANLYSLIETARNNGLEPYAYLKHLFTALPLAESVDDYDALLPWN
ncbi:IS66 family transposase, partial [Magnetococcales bacterium HHB-1]